MKIIKHRMNSIEEVRHLGSSLGAEIDLRSKENKIILTHDPFSEGDEFEAFLEEWVRKPRGTLVLNPKEDGIEKMTLSLLSKWGVVDFFFLDLAMPTAIRMMKDSKFRKMAVRVSEFEPPDGSASFEGQVDWAWLDCFTGSPAPRKLVDVLARKFKVCLVSPELQGYSQEHISDFLHLIPFLSAVCTKYPLLWGVSEGPRL